MQCLFYGFLGFQLEQSRSSWVNNVSMHWPWLLHNKLLMLLYKNKMLLSSKRMFLNCLRTGGLRPTELSMNLRADIFGTHMVYVWTSVVSCNWDVDSLLLYPYQLLCNWGANSDLFHPHQLRCELISLWFHQYSFVCSLHVHRFTIVLLLWLLVCSLKIFLWTLIQTSC